MAGHGIRRTSVSPSGLDVVAPVVDIAGWGWLSVRLRATVDSRPVARLSFHILTLCLVFGSLSHTGWMGSAAKTDNARLYGIQRGSTDVTGAVDSARATVLATAQRRPRDSGVHSPIPGTLHLR